MTIKELIQEILNENLSKIKVRQDVDGLMEGYSNKTKVTDTSELRLMQIVLARKAVIEKSGYLGEQLQAGEYLAGDHSKSSWTVYKLNDLIIKINQKLSCG